MTGAGALDYCAGCWAAPSAAGWVLPTLASSDLVAGMTANGDHDPLSRYRLAAVEQAHGVRADELGALVKAEIQKWNSVVEKAGIPRID